ncbi:H-NS histone [Pseudomonas aeruginosa]|uniref:histone-like nucleoid-structuring protein, MvaT/MvaU family n=1 Tax=Pseudomonas aeruginosa TaxID=287 RepID=UPI000FC41C0F|nr:histone-like nucleoid-structuring protein, MvaT/MvaU family [Pseudomonas aeruginosa]RUE83521.1 H-NS histone [Pseudomonas aeruginosa]
MSLINEYRATEEAIKELQDRLNSLQSDGRLQRELEFEEKLRELMASYGKTLKDINAIFGPKVAAKPGKQPGQRRERELQVYINPNTQERIETKGGNHLGLKAWKQQYGADVVKSWKQA